MAASPMMQPQRRATEKPIAIKPCPVIFATGTGVPPFGLSEEQFRYQVIGIAVGAVLLARSLKRSDSAPWMAA